MSNSIPNSLRDWYEKAIEQPVAQRVAWLQAHCTDAELSARVLRLLDAAEKDAPAGLLQRTPTQLVQDMGDNMSDAASLVGEQLGPYLLRNVIGEGGSATVFKAERDLKGVRQTVALKLMHRNLHSPESRRSFRRERQALTHLSHPNIARLIDAGVTELSQAYLAMELVEGRTIDRYAEVNQLEERARIMLVVTVCRAVAAAHQLLIVHRDLKPSNILVTHDGQIKLLDFGIAKLLDDDAEQFDHTEQGRAPLTPAYAAPEQLSGGVISTATDVYSLGAVLFELLTGSRAHQRTQSVSAPDGKQAANTATHEASYRTDQRRKLGNDIDTILHKALDEDAMRRYANAAELADDLERYLANQPVRAVAPTRWYRVRKFVRRNRGSVLLGSIALTMVMASLALSIWQASVARREATKATLVRDFVVSVFDSARASLPRDQRPTPELLVEQAAARMADMPNLDPATRMELLETLGNVWISLAKFDAAELAFAESLALAQSLGKTDIVRRLIVSQASVWQRAGRNKQGVTALTQIVPSLSDSPEQLAKALSVLASAQFELGKANDAFLSATEAERASAAAFGANSLAHLTARFELGVLLSSMERHQEAIAMLDPAIAQWRASKFPNDDRFLRGFKAQTVAREALGTLIDAQASYRELLALHKRLYIAPHDAIAATLRGLAAVLTQTEDYEEALRLLDEALAMHRALRTSDHNEQIAMLDLRGFIHSKQRAFDKADIVYAEALAICRNKRLDSEVCSRVHNNRGMNFYRQNQLPEAEAEMRLALVQRRARFGDKHLTIAVSQSTLGDVLTRAGRAAEAVPLQRDALAIFAELGMQDSSNYALMLNSLALSQLSSKDYPAALATINSALTLWHRKAPEGKARAVTMRVIKIKILTAMKRLEEARDVANEAIALNVDPKLNSDLEKEALRTASGRNKLYR
jgi:eukaryotic-like serine/threonine-protein kinase